MGPLRVALVMAIAACALAGRSQAPARAQDPPPEPQPSPTIDVSPTPTRRPTRTPRATPLPTNTPLPSGGLRVAVGSDPAAPAVGDAVQWVVTIENLAPGSSGELLLDVALPGVLVAERIDVTVGETAREGRAVRWYVPNLGPGATAELRAGGVAGRVTARQEPDRGCVQLLSRGAPVDFCSRFDVLEVGAQADEPAAAEPPALPTAPTGIGLVDAVPSPRTSLGLSTLVIGLGVLGAWIGTALRGARTRRAQTPAEAQADAHESEKA